MVLLDTCNQYEVAVGSFQNTITLPNLNYFRDFLEQAAQTLSTMKDKTIVTFCMGGIRCEISVATIKK